MNFVAARRIITVHTHGCIREARRNSAAAASDRGSPPGKVLRGRQFPGHLKKTGRILEDVDHAIDLLTRVVEVKAGARCSGHAETPHQWLIAMMTTAHGETVTIRKRGQIVRVRRVHDKLMTPPRSFIGPITRKPGTRPFPSTRIPQDRHRAENFSASDPFDVIDRRAQPDRSGDVGRAGFETVRRFFE